MFIVTIKVEQSKLALKCLGDFCSTGLIAILPVRTPAGLRQPEILQHQYLLGLPVSAGSLDWARLSDGEWGVERVCVLGVITWELCLLGVSSPLPQDSTLQGH